MKRTSSTFDSGDTVSSNPVRLFSNHDRAKTARERHGVFAPVGSRRRARRLAAERRRAFSRLKKVLLTSGRSSRNGPQSFDRQPNLVQIFFAVRGRLFNTRNGTLDQFIDDTSQARAYALVSTEDQLGRFHRDGVDKPPKRPKMRHFPFGKCAVNSVGEDQKNMVVKPSFVHLSFSETILDRYHLQN
jgi:hypothetical protein